MADTMTTDRTPKPREVSHGARWAIGAALLLALAIAGLAIGAQSITPWVRNRIVQTMEETFASRLELKSLDVSLFPSVRISGQGLTLRQKGVENGPPLITVDRFSAHTSLLSLFRIPTAVNHVRIEGLQIHVRTGGEKRPDNGPAGEKKPPNFVIDDVVADGARLETLPAKPGKVLLVWNIKTLTLHHTGPERPLSFVATLTNAKPPGDIQSSGSFGPWQRDDPAETPVSGKYTFSHADLSVFRGISGTLSSEGSYHGVLARIEAEGHTDTPDFAVSIAGNRVDLATEFHALIDGTNGTTRLQPVVARFGRSTLTAQGIVDTTPGKPGQIISLDVRTQDGRLEDMLRMAVKGKAPLTGAVSFHTKFLLPIGNQEVTQALQLDGSFDASDARFSKADAQQKVDKLSNRSRGQTDDAADDSVASDFRGRFKLSDGVMHFSDLSFLVPGATVALNGEYTLADGSMDLRGTARLQAKLSQTTTGFKSFLLKAVDPFFSKKGAGTVLPIRISGTRDSPSFGLNLGGKTK